MAIPLDSLQRDFIKYVDQIMKEGKQAKQTAKQKSRQEQAVVVPDAVVASETPAPGRKRGRKPKSEESVAPIA